MGDQTGRRWFEQPKEFIARPQDGSEDHPDLWTKCPDCGLALYNEALAADLMVCSGCGHHMRLSALARITSLVDAGEVTYWDDDLGPVDRLGFVDSKPYPKRIVSSQSKTGRRDAFMACTAAIHGVPVELGVLDFSFMGGSMGSVVGECITRLYERALENNRPAIIVSASGGARMQEGVLSLMQMAKTSAALSELQRRTSMPYISVLTNPTTGGVAASFAMLGDLIFAEPGALVGFAGARVIKQTIGQDLPEGFQTAEYLLEHGMVDAIVSRHDLRSTLGQTLRLMLGLPEIDQRMLSVHEASEAQEE